MLFWFLSRKPQKNKYTDSDIFFCPGRWGGERVVETTIKDDDNDDEENKDHNNDDNDDPVLSKNMV